MKDNSACSSSALLFLDGDNFKYINDTWGHAAGDRVLIEVAKRLAEFAGNRYQTYRLGGDEFAMVLYGVHSEYEVQRICAALSQLFNRPFELHNGQRITISLSIVFARHGSSPLPKNYKNGQIEICIRLNTKVANTR